MERRTGIVRLITAVTFEVSVFDSSDNPVELIGKRTSIPASFASPVGIVKVIEIETGLRICLSDLEMKASDAK